MRYSFGVSDYSLPLYIDSVSNNWPQEPIHRKKGYPYVHWLQTVQGVGRVTIGERTFLLHPGQGVLINQNVPHDYHALDSEWTTAYFTFGGELIAEMMTTLKINHYILIKEPDKQLYEFTDRCYRQVRAQSVDTYRASIWVYEFLLLIKKNQAKNEVDSRLVTEIVTPIMKFIRESYMRDLNNQDFVDQTHYSLQYILSTFRAYCDSSPHQLLMDYRVRKAKELLANRMDLSVEMVGKQVGFNTNSYFITTFKQRERVTPGHFRAFFRD